MQKIAPCYHVRTEKKLLSEQLLNASPTIYMFRHVQLEPWSGALTFGGQRVFAPSVTASKNLCDQCIPGDPQEHHFIREKTLS